MRKIIKLFFWAVIAVMSGCESTSQQSQPKPVETTQPGFTKISIPDSSGQSSESSEVFQERPTSRHAQEMMAQSRPAREPATASVPEPPPIKKTPPPEPAKPRAQKDEQPAMTSSGGQADKLRVGDMIRVKLGGVPAEERRDEEFRINDGGTISIPHLPPVEVVGKSTGVLERHIEKLYREKRIFTHPTVSVMVSGRFVNVIGEVRAPQRISFTSDLTVLSALSASGGFTEYANKSAIRIQRGNQVITVNAKAALKDPKKDIPLHAGDTMEVRRSVF